MLGNVFTYGTLQVPAVMFAVTGRRFASTPAILPRYRRLNITGKTYPGIIEDESAETCGRLYNNIDQNALVLLDRFEDVLYSRRVVQVIVDGEAISAYAYVVNNEYRDMLGTEDWDLHYFEERHLPAYLQRIISG